MIFLLKNILWSFFLILTLSVEGQSIVVSSINNNVTKAIDPRTFDCIPKNYSINNRTYVATLNGFVINSGKSILSNLFKSFWKKANELGANSFLIENIRESSDMIAIEISIYNLSDDELQDVVKLYPSNMVYVYGDLDRWNDPQKIKFNNETIQLHSLEFISYQNRVGEDAVLIFGGFTGTKVWIRGREDRLPEHLSLDNFGVGFGMDLRSITFNTGRIYPMNLNLGQFLTNVLTERKIVSTITN